MRIQAPLLLLAMLLGIGGGPVFAQEICYDTCQNWVCDPQTWVEDWCPGGCHEVCDTCEDCWQECDMDTCWPVCNSYPCNCHEECDPPYVCGGHWDPDPPNCYWGTPYQCNPHDCPPVCGDGYCAPGLEDCGTCLTDCPCWDPATPICQANQCVPPVCGDTACSAGEDCSTCADDCGVCPPPDPYCGDATCGANEDCTSCSADCGACPPPPGDVYIYSDENYDGSNLMVSASAENTAGGHVELEVTVTKEADGSILGTQSSSGSGSTALTLDAPYTAVENDVESLDGGTALVVLVLGRAVIGGILKSIFKRTSIKVGVSTLWYEISGQSSDSAGVWCDYLQITPCTVNCASNLRTDRLVAEGFEFFECPFQFMSRDVAWVTKNSVVVPGSCKKNPFASPRNSRGTCTTKK